ncbi:MAG TPA: dTDP-4-dehydrorhamnose reductase [Solirubrobacteraceae bacterium]|jgi:dTDP-4-dehydrorhamnose reductase|nr:dTDP-4-dehydrorhamnose reductase [Solirubrobacteraceae bacterium]
MKLLVTGAAGMLGTDVQLAARAAGHDAVPLSRAELDISDREAVAGALAEAQPDAVLNCAAFTDVDGAEADPDAAAAVNATGAGILAEAAASAGAWVVHVSTDYLFDGTKTSPYVESDPTGPRSIYGSTKLLGERAVALAAPAAHTIVRSSWLFGTAGSCFPATMLKLAAERDTLTVVEDQVGCPTFTGHLAPALVDLATRTRLPGVLHLAASGQCSWYEFAVEIMRVTGTAVEVLPCSTDEFPRPARRPAFSVLRSERPEAPTLPGWQQGLSDYLSERVVA